jgi:putative Holliday junction resolvase
MVAQTKFLLALDVGERRVGVSRAHSDVRIAQPLLTLERTQAVFEEIQELVEANQAVVLVVGLPRGLEGQDTAQTKTVRDFASQLETLLQVPIVLQDEALTSHKAEAELEKRGKPYAKGDVDALAATYILEDYMAENLKGHA